MTWKRDKNLMAERFRKDELPGFLSKQFEVKGDEFLLLEKNGEIYLEKDHGTLSVSSFMGDFTDIVMIDKSEKTFEDEIKGVVLSDGRKIGIKLAIKFRVLNSDHFSKNLLGQRKRLFLEDVWSELVSEVICRKMIPKLQKKPSKDFASEDFRAKARTGLEEEVKKKFGNWGLMLESLAMDFHIPGEENAESREARENDDAISKPRGEGESGKTGATIDEDVDDLEKERLEKEVDIQLEKKQMQEDVEDAMEAMELKGIMEKKKLLKAGDAKAGERSDLIAELENLKKAKEMAERKYYKKDLSEESFQRMMEEFEKRIIEIAAKLKRQ